MKVFAVGGSGKVGIEAIKILAGSDLVTEIAVGGRDRARTEQAVAATSEKAVAVTLDATDEEQLTTAFMGYDLVLHAAWSNSILPTIRSALRAGAHYCDASTFGEFVEQIRPLAAEVEAAGTTVIVATGIHPCISNLMGVHVARRLDLVEQLQLGCAFVYNSKNGCDLSPAQWQGDPQESLTVLQSFRPFFGMTLGMAQQSKNRSLYGYRDTEKIETDPVRNGVDAPTGRGGTAPAYPYLSVDPIFGSLPVDLSASTPVEMQFSPLPPQLHDLVRALALQVAGGEIDAEAATVSLFDTVESDPHRWLTTPKDWLPPAQMWTRAVGRKDGRAARSTCWLTPALWRTNVYYLSSAALAVAALKMLRGETPGSGVFTAEKAFDPKPFFDQLGQVVSDLLPDGEFVNESLEWLD